METIGTITTVAGNGSQGFAGDGGVATSATLDTPRVPAVQATGVIALSDTDNNLIREVGSNGVINTITGTGQGQVAARELAEKPLPSAARPPLLMAAPLRSL